MNRDNIINVKFDSLIDYLREKDLEIENFRIKHLKEFELRKHYQEKCKKIRQLIDLDKTNDHADLIDELYEILNELEN